MSVGSALLNAANNIGLIKLIQKVPWANSLVNQAAINVFSSATAPRPLPYTLWTPVPAADPYIPAAPPKSEPVRYISWTGLVNRRFSGRHLPPADADYAARLPKLDDVVALYDRTSFTPSKTTSSLLSFFAQWFTDSVLRTDPFDRRLNTSNHEIDLCQIYGLDAETSAYLRTQAGGKLRTSPDGLFPQRLSLDGEKPNPDFAGLRYLNFFNPPKTPIEALVMGSFKADPDVMLARKKALYATGLERGNSTIVYAAISVIFLREHNRLCDVLHQANPTWDDDRLFQTARNINIVLLLKLVVNEYINHLAHFPFKVSLQRGFAEKQRWYRPNRIAIEFDLLYRWHSLTPDVVTVNGVKLSGQEYRFNNELLEREGVEAVIASASREPAGRLGVGNNPAFLKDAEWKAHEFARDQRLRPFVEYQRAFGKKPVTSFLELAGDPKLAERLSKLYQRVEDVELLVGLFAQQHGDDRVLPDTLTAMVAVDAFSQIFTNPLLATGIYCPDAFGEQGHGIIESTNSFQQVVTRNAAPGVDPKSIYASFDL